MVNRILNEINSFYPEQRSYSSKLEVLLNKAGKLSEIKLEQENIKAANDFIQAVKLAEQNGSKQSFDLKKVSEAFDGIVNNLKEYKGKIGADGSIKAPEKSSSIDQNHLGDLIEALNIFKNNLGTQAKPYIGNISSEKETLIENIQHLENYTNKYFNKDSFGNLISLLEKFPDSRIMEKTLSPDLYLNIINKVEEGIKDIPTNGRDYTSNAHAKVQAFIGEEKAAHIEAAKKAQPNLKLQQTGSTDLLAVIAQTRAAA